MLGPASSCLPPALSASQPRAGRLTRPGRAPAAAPPPLAPLPGLLLPPLPGGPVRKTCLDMAEGSGSPRSSLSPTRRGPAGGIAALHRPFAPPLAFAVCLRGSAEWRPCFAGRRGNAVRSSAAAAARPEGVRPPRSCLKMAARVAVNGSGRGASRKGVGRF